MAWVKERYPHLKLQRFGWTQRPELFRPLHQSVPSTPSTLRRNKKREVFAIVFEDDQQATNFKLRWV